ncbi:hypothetical protein ANCDUO_22356, partial [Ancylostoma duodenale]
FILQSLIYDLKDVSCVDSRWDCEEAEDILWTADRTLDAYLSVSAVLQQKFHYELNRNDPVEEFILSNGMSSSAILRKEVELASSSCTMTQQGRSEWMRMLSTLTEKEKLDKLQRDTSYLPDDLNELQIPLLPPPKQAKEQLEELLKISGSSDAKSCPDFPLLYENLAKAGYDQRVFARFMIVVVDNGCTAMDELLSTHHSDKHFFYLVEYFYCWLGFWFTQVLFQSCRSTLCDSSLDSKVHQRVLKTLKLFASKADCSFVVRYITKSRSVPAFFVVATRAKFWHEVVKRCSSFSELPSLQRILLLIFLTRLSLGHPLCYSETVQTEIQTMMSSVISLVCRTKDIRERRFCMEVAAALSPSATHVGVLKILEEREENDENRVMRADCDFLEYILKKFDSAAEEHPNHRRIPTDLHQSPYIGLIESSQDRSVEPYIIQTHFHGVTFGRVNASSTCHGPYACCRKFANYRVSLSL